MSVINRSCIPIINDIIIIGNDKTTHSELNCNYLLAIYVLFYIVERWLGSLVSWNVSSSEVCCY